MIRMLYILLPLFVVSSCKDKPKSTVSEVDSIVALNSNQISVGKGPDALFVTPNKKYVYVANVEDTLVSVVDVQTDSVIAEIENLKYPWGFTQLAESDNVAVSNHGGTIGIIDYETHNVIRSKDYGTPLGGITSSDNGKKLFVVAIDKDEVYEINSESLEIVRTFKTGKGPDGIGLSANNSKIYITNTTDGTISIIDTKTKEEKVLNKGGKPELIHNGKNNENLLISNFENNEAYILNTETDSIVHTINDLNGPEEVVQSNDGKTYYIVNFKSSKVYVFDAENYQKLPKEYEVGKSPIGFIQIDENKAYVSNYADNTLTILKLKDK